MRKMIRVFISSTFTRFEGVRDTLVGEVFPEIQELCRKNGFSFRAIDLRWGITENEGRQHQVADICFEEIRRCIKYSPAPNFIVLSDDYYGWIPAPASISKACWSRVREELEKTDPDGLEYLGKWYRKDLNDLSESMILQYEAGNQEKEIFDQDVEKKICGVLFPAARKVLPDQYSMRVAFGGSLTEQEISLGFFSQEGAREHTLVMIRETKTEQAEDEKKDSEPAEAEQTEADKADVKPAEAEQTEADKADVKPAEAEPAEEGKADADKAETEDSMDSAFNAHNLNRRLKKAMSGRDRPRWIPIREGHVAEDARQFLIPIVQKQINKVLKEEKEETAFQREYRELEEALAQAEEEYIEMAGRLSQLENFAGQNKGRAAVIRGEQGSGKSTLLKYFVRKNPDTCLGVFAELQGGRSTVESALRFLAESLLMKGLLNGIVTRDPQESCVGWFERQMEQLSKDAEVTMVVDCAELLTDFKTLEESLFSLRLPRGAVLLVSCVDESALSNLDLQYRPPMMSLNPVGRAECRTVLFEMLEGYGRTLTAFQKECLQEKMPETATPLYLRQLAASLRNVRAYTEEEGLPGEYETMPGDTFSLVKNTLKRHMGTQVSGLYRHVLAYIALSTRGLSEGELVELLLREMNRGSDLNTELLHNTFWKIKNREHVVNVFWARMFFQLQDYLGAYPDHENMLIRFRHGVIRDAAVAAAGSVPVAENFRDYWMEQDVYTSVQAGSVIVNRRRADELLPVLLYLNNTGQVRILLENMYNLDAMIRLDRYDQLLNRLEKAEKEGYSSEKIQMVLALLKNYEMLLTSFCDSFLPLCVQCGLSDQDVLSKTGMQGWFETEEKAPIDGGVLSKTGMQGRYGTGGKTPIAGGRADGLSRNDAVIHIPQCARSPMALRGDGIMAVMDRGSIRIYDWTRRRYSSASFPMLIQNADCLYWKGDTLILRRYKKRLTFQYVKTPGGAGDKLLLKREEDCTTLLNLFSDKEEVCRMAGPVEEEDAAGERNDRLVRYHSSLGGVRKKYLYYPLSLEITYFLHGGQAAIVKDREQINLVDLDSEMVRETIHAHFISGVFYSDDGRSILIRTGMNTVIFHPITDRGSFAMPVLKGSEKEFQKELKAYKRRKDFNFAIVFSPRKKGDVPYLPPGRPADGSPDPILFCMSAARQWYAAYYYYNDIAVVRVFDLKTGGEILSSEVEPIYSKDISESPFFAGDGGNSIVIRSGGIRRSLDLTDARPVWKKEKEKEAASPVTKALSDDFTGHMWRWIPHRHKFETLEDLAVNTFDTKAGSTGFRLLTLIFAPVFRSFRPEKVNNPVYMAPPQIIRTEKYIWLVDYVFRTIHVADPAGRWLCHTLIREPFAAADASGDTLFLFPEEYDGIMKVRFVSGGLSHRDKKTAGRDQYNGS